MLRKLMVLSVTCMVLVTQSGCSVNPSAAASDVVTGWLSTVFANMVAGVVNGAVPVG